MPIKWRALHALGVIAILPVGFGGYLLRKQQIIAATAPKVVIKAEAEKKSQ